MPQLEGSPGAVAQLQQLVKTAELSSYRENLLEQLLSVELIQACWLRDLPPLELAHAFVDFSGYDLVASCGGVTRHIQLKATAGKIILHRALALKPSGCCVLLKPMATSQDETPPRITMTYRFLGGLPNEPLVIDAAWRPARGTRYARTSEGEFARPERTNHVEVPRSAFGRALDVDGLVTALFGDAPKIDSEITGTK
jgi:hypothetical protein